MIEFLLEVAAQARPYLTALIILIAVLIFALVVLRQHRIDRAVKAFQKAGLRVNSDTVQRLRDDFAKVAAENERQKIVDDHKRQQELSLVQRERDRILSAVQSAPVVVREAGRALQAIEREYEAGLALVKSEQAKEALRLAAEKQINDVLRSVNIEPGSLRMPQFTLAEDLMTIEDASSNGGSGAANGQRDLHTAAT
ncbi:MAG: hypothetical protein U0528_15800 [Anaerolineae bacterium]|nr:hypothetical protein [Anaerolineae bacterium]